MENCNNPLPQGHFQEKAFRKRYIPQMSKQITQCQNMTHVPFVKMQCRLFATLGNLVMAHSSVIQHGCSLHH